jgi:hypothetical protein
VLKLGNTEFDCGCGTRKETLGEENFWTGLLFVGGLLILALTYGGNVTKQTKNVLGVAAAGAIIAVLADKVINPTLKG